jgi:hypothetical protein
MDVNEAGRIFTHTMKLMLWLGGAFAAVAALVALREIADSLKFICSRFNDGSFTQVNMPRIGDEDQAMREARK